MSIIDESSSEIRSARLRIAALSSPVTKRMLANRTDYGWWLTFSYYHDDDTLIVRFERHINCEPGSPEDISSIATDLCNKSYSHDTKVVLHKTAHWAVEENISYSQRLTQDEMDTLRALGKMKTHTSEYESVYCTR